MAARQAPSRCILFIKERLSLVATFRKRFEGYGRMLMIAFEQSWPLSPTATPGGDVATTHPGGPIWGLAALWGHGAGERGQIWPHLGP